MTDPIATPGTPPVPTDAELLKGIADAAAPLAGPYGVIADQLLTAGLAFWADYQAKKAAGNLTMADLEAAAAKTSVDLAQLKADVDALPA